MHLPAFGVLIAQNQNNLLLNHLIRLQRRYAGGLLQSYLNARSYQRIYIMIDPRLTQIFHIIPSDDRARCKIERAPRASSKVKNCVCSLVQMIYTVLKHVL
jgi:hypothetical protein